MNASKTCAKCGAALATDAVLDVCTRCVAPQILSPPAADDTPDTSPDSASGSIRYLPGPLEKPGDRIGRYKILQQIGEGGCGTVYMAEQTEPVRRRVALKVIKLGMDTKQVVARFEAERQALAMMDHPNIAKFFDAGLVEVRSEKCEGRSTTAPAPTSPLAPLTSSLNSRPYFVMELVRGVRITEYCDDNNLSSALTCSPRFVTPCNTRIRRASSTATLSRRTSSSPSTTVCRSRRLSTSASPRPPNSD